jgi:hypothetical protein
LLPVKAQFFGRRLTFLPPGSEIRVVECDSMAAGGISSDGADQLMFLAFAVEKGGGEGVEAALLGKTGGGIQAHGIAYEAAILFAEDHLSKEILERILGTDDQRQVPAYGQLAERIEAPLELLVRMDVGIEKETMDLPVLIPQGPKRDDGARAAARV